MIAEALKYLADTAVKGSKPFVSRAEPEPSHVYYLNGERTEATPAPCNFTAKDLTAIVQFATQNPKSTVWYSSDGVIVILDPETRRNHVTLPLEYSPQLYEIVSWGDRSKPISQRDLILKLRTVFKRCLDHSPQLIELLRALRFTTGTTTDAKVSASKTSIGKSVEAEVTGAAALPDEFYLDVPIFSGGAFMTIRGRVEVAIEVDAAAATFTLHPIPGMVSQQIALAEGSIGQTLRAAIGEDRVHYGNPNTVAIDLADD